MAAPPSRVGALTLPPVAGQGRAALVMASDRGLPYPVLRCAAACFDAVHVLGTATARPLRRSRHCASFITLPPGQPGFGINTVDALCARHGISHILPGDGPATAFLAMHGAALAAPCYPVPDAASFALLDDKARFAALCRSLGVPVPESRVVADRAALLALLPEDRAETLVAKPLGLSASQGVYVITPRSPARAIAGIHYAPILLQSHVLGPDLCAFYLCRAGQVLAEVAYAPEAGTLASSPIPASAAMPRPSSRICTTTASSASTCGRRRMAGRASSDVPRVSGSASRRPCWPG